MNPLIKGNLQLQKANNIKSKNPVPKFISLSEVVKELLKIKPLKEPLKGLIKNKKGGNQPPSHL